MLGFHLALVLFFSLVFASADACDLNVTLINQDPYPTVPGDYVKLVFQIKGIESPDCGDITFELLKDYPIEFDPGESGLRIFKKVDYLKDFETNILIPYEVRVNEDALDGSNPIEANIQSSGDSALSKTFSLEVEDSRADFEVYVRDYDYTTHELTLEILNIEDSDVEALTLEIPKQQNIEVKGPSRVVVGDLDSNEYTSADFEATVKDGEIKVDIIYTDSINIRRTLTKTINFDSSYFTNRIADKKTTSSMTYLLYAAVVLVIGYYIYHKRKKRKEKHSKHH